MKSEKIQLASLIITGIGIVVIVGAIIWSNHHLSRFVPTPPPASTSTTVSQTPPASADQSISICYALNSNGNNATLEITTTDGQHASGTLNVALAEKDASKGTLNGTLTPTADNSSALFDGQYVNNQEGMNNSTEQRIELDQTEAKIGYGEMVKNTDGSYGYKDPSTINYSLSIPRVACQQ